jgi:hypothetical protein
MTNNDCLLLVGRKAKSAAPSGDLPRYGACCQPGCPFLFHYPTPPNLPASPTATRALSFTSSMAPYGVDTRGLCSLPLQTMRKQRPKERQMLDFPTELSKVS